MDKGLQLADFIIVCSNGHPRIDSYCSILLPFTCYGIAGGSCSSPARIFSSARFSIRLT